MSSPRPFTSVIRTGGWPPVAVTAEAGPVVVGTDFSVAARAAEDFAAGHAEHLGAPLEVVHAVRPPRLPALGIEDPVALEEALRKDRVATFGANTLPPPEDVTCTRCGATFPLDDTFLTPAMFWLFGRKSAEALMDDKDAEAL